MTTTRTGSILQMWRSRQGVLMQSSSAPRFAFSIGVYFEDCAVLCSRSYTLPPGTDARAF